MTAAAPTIEALDLDLADPTTCEVCDTDHEPRPAAWACICTACAYTLDHCAQCKTGFEEALHLLPRFAHLIGEWGCKGCAAPTTGPGSFTFRRLP